MKAYREALATHAAQLLRKAHNRIRGLRPQTEPESLAPPGSQNLH